MSDVVMWTGMEQIMEWAYNSPHQSFMNELCLWWQIVNDDDDQATMVQIPTFTIVTFTLQLIYLIDKKLQPPALPNKQTYNPQTEAARRAISLTNAFILSRILTTG